MKEVPRNGQNMQRNMIQLELVQSTVNYILTQFLHILISYFHLGTDTYPHDNGIIRAINSKYKPNKRIVGDPRHTIFVGRLHMKTDEVK